MPPSAGWSSQHKVHQTGFLTFRVHFWEQEEKKNKQHHCLDLNISASVLIGWDAPDTLSTIAELLSKHFYPRAPGGPPNTIFNDVTFGFFFFFWVNTVADLDASESLSFLSRLTNTSLGFLLCPFNHMSSQAMQREQSSVISDFTKPSSGATIASCHLHISCWTDMTFALKRPLDAPSKVSAKTDASFDPSALWITLVFLWEKP